MGKGNWAEAASRDLGIAGMGVEVLQYWSLNLLLEVVRQPPAYHR